MSADRASLGLTAEADDEAEVEADSPSTQPQPEEPKRYKALDNWHGWITTRCFLALGLETLSWRGSHYIEVDALRALITLDACQPPSFMRDACIYQYTEILNRPDTIFAVSGRQAFGTSNDRVMKIVRSAEYDDHREIFVEDKAEPGHELSVILSVPRDQPKPKHIGLYIWHAPYMGDGVWAEGGEREQKLTAAAELATGQRVKRAIECSGNGHGTLELIYEEDV